MTLSPRPAAALAAALTLALAPLLAQEGKRPPPKSAGPAPADPAPPRPKAPPPEELLPLPAPGPAEGTLDPRGPRDPRETLAADGKDSLPPVYESAMAHAGRIFGTSKEVPILDEKGWRCPKDMAPLKISFFHIAKDPNAGRVMVLLCEKEMIYWMSFVEGATAARTLTGPFHPHEGADAAFEEVVIYANKKVKDLEHPEPRIRDRAEQDLRDLLTDLRTRVAGLSGPAKGLETRERAGRLLDLLSGERVAVTTVSSDDRARERFTYNLTAYAQHPDQWELAVQRLKEMSETNRGTQWGDKAFDEMNKILKEQDEKVRRQYEAVKFEAENLFMRAIKDKDPAPAEQAERLFKAFMDQYPESRYSRQLMEGLVRYRTLLKDITDKSKKPPAPAPAPGPAAALSP